MLKEIGAGDLIMADRGYPSRRMFSDIEQQKAAYLIRLLCGKAGVFSEVRACALDDSQWDSEIDLQEDRKNAEGPVLRVRLVKYRLPNGEIAVFSTNLLNRTEHPLPALCALYCYRWHIETAFREMKVWHGLENFNARFANGIHQEVSALMIFMLLTAELEHQARDQHNVKMRESPAGVIEEPEIRFNRKLIAECVGHLLIAATNGVDAINIEYANCLEQLWRFRQKRRPGRTFERIAKSANSKWKRTTYNSEGK